MSSDYTEDAANPRRVTTDEGTVEERSIDEKIKADQYQSTKNAADAVPWGIRIARIKPGGTTNHEP